MQAQHQPELCTRELIRFAFNEFANNDKHYVHKFWILKVLYLVKKRLAQGNHVKNDLAFYWYKYGPYSEVIVNTLDSDKNIIKNFDGSYSYSEQDRKAPIISCDESLREAFNKTSPIIKRFSKNNIRMAVYNDAPYQWYEYYNEFKDILYAYYGYIFERDLNPYIHTDILESLDNTLGSIPLGPRFSEFRLAYNGFVRMVISLLKVQDPSNYKTQFSKLCSLSDDIWNVFTKGVRIKYHDPYYNDRLETWEKDYQKALASLAADIKNSEKTLGIPEPAIPDNEIEIIDPDIDPSDVYTPAEAIKEIDRIINS